MSAIVAHWRKAARYRSGPIAELHGCTEFEYLRGGPNDPIYPPFTPRGALLITVLPVLSCLKWFAQLFSLLKWLAPIATIALGAGLVNIQLPLRGA